MKVLCVCLGNICRSPTAEAVLRHHADGRLEVDSAGTGAWHIGDPPYGPAIQAAARRGYDLAPLRARRFIARDFEVFDLILAMDRRNLEDVEALRPPGNRTRTALILEFAPSCGTEEVPDPYYTGDFEGVLDLIEFSAKGMLETL